MDLFCILVSILLTLIFGTSLKIREGTVISMVIVGPVLGFTMDFIRKHPLSVFR